MIKSILKYYISFAKLVNRYIWSEEAVLKRPAYIKYSFAGMLIVLTTVIKLYFFREIGSETPFLLYFGVVILCTGFGGIGPGIFATLITALVTRYYFLQPFKYFSFTTPQAIQISVYIGESLFLISLSGAVTRASRALRKSSERFKAMIENSTDAIAVLDKHGKVLYGSPATEKVIGYTSKELKAMDLKDKLMEDESKEVKKFYADILKNEDASKTILLKFLNKKGEWIWVESTFTNLLHHLSVKGVVANFRNVTQTLFLEKQKDDFISIATHELKTPVTSIKAYAQILLARFRKDGNTPAAVMLEKMDGQLNKLIGLIGDLLDVTRIEGDRLPLNEGLYQFNDLVKETVEELQRATDNHKIIIKLDGDKEVFGDKERIAQVLTNLITNAIKYSPASKDIFVSTASNNATITVCVEDTGVGIAREKQAKVFERFYRVSGPENQTFPGLGLGLYISHEIVKRQGGRIWVESEKGKGSTFCFSLPVDYRLNAANINSEQVTS